MGTRVTIQDIADELGISRNTVSKAINNTGILADSTREKVLKKAMEMGYKQFSYVTAASAASGSAVLSIPAAKQNTEIALFDRKFYRRLSFCFRHAGQISDGALRAGVQPDDAPDPGG